MVTPGLSVRYMLAVGGDTVRRSALSAGGDAAHGGEEPEGPRVSLDLRHCRGPPPQRDRRTKGAPGAAIRAEFTIVDCGLMAPGLG